MRYESLVGLVQIDLPDATIRLTDGGEFPFNGNKFLGRDPVFGVISAIGTIDEGNGDDAPEQSIILNPDKDAGVGDLLNDGHQGARVRIWLSTFDMATGLLTGDAEPFFDGGIDVTELQFGKGVRRLDIDVVTRMELMLRNGEGNTLSPRFHKRLYPGETGHDRAIDLPIPVAWGTEAPPRQQSAGAASGGGSGIRGRFGAGIIGAVSLL